MPASRPPLRKARAVARRIRRAPDYARRVGRKVANRRPHDGPALSLVIPVYNVREWIRPALDSVLTQSLEDIEFIVVDDGSTDGSADIVREYAAEDDRIRIVTKENAGLGAARNTGAEYATGEFIAFFDSDDLVMPDAYRDMVNQLRHSGSDFITGAFARGDAATAIKPHWVNRTMGRNRSGISLKDEPDLLLDITAWNKVFRRSFWSRHEFRFMEGVRYEDQVPITRAYLTARSIDVLRQKVYVWRTRLDGSSITQQKASILDLTDRLRSQEQCAELMRKAPQVVRESWYLKLLDYDLPNYLIAALNADEAYLAMLQDRLERLRDEVPETVWHRVAFRNRVKSWLLSHGHLDLAVQMRAWFEQHPAGLPTRAEGDHLEYVPPFEVSEADLPHWLRQVYAVDVRPVVRLVETRWEDHTLVLRGSAYLTPLPTSMGTHVLELNLVADDGQHLAVPLTRYADPGLDHLARLAFADMSETGFEARLDAEWLARVAPAGQTGLRLQFTQTQAGFERVSDITHVFNLGSGGSREPHECGGRLVRLAGVVDTGHRVQVHDTYAWTAGHRMLHDTTLELTLRTSVSDPVVSATLGDLRSVDPELTVSSDEPGTVRVVVTPGPSRRLVTRHASGRRLHALWGEEPGVLGEASAGGFVHRGGSQSVLVDEPKPAVAVSGVAPGERSLVVRGTAFAAEGHRLLLLGTRTNGLASEPLPAGDFEVEVPLVQDPWNLGPGPLPLGSYDLALLAPPGGEDVPDDDGYVFADGSLRARLPLVVEHADQNLDVGMTHLSTLVVRTTALPEADAPQRRQRWLRTEVYEASIGEPLLPCVLFETFTGTSAGDSPAAIARELVRRGSELDLVWSVADGSVRVPEGTRAVVRLSEEWYALLARAAYVVNNANFPYFFRKAPGQVYLQTWHGTPLKKIANDIEDKRFLSITYQQTMVYEASVWDHLVSPSPYCSEILPRAFGYHGPVLETGYPRNDALVRPGHLEAGRDVRRRLGIRDDQRVLLYAPTWRDTARSGGAHSKVLYLDPVEVVTALPGTVVLVRGHANTSAGDSVGGDGSSGVIDVTLYPDINDLFLASDALVTDYSSVMFDYVTLDRPIMFLVPDLADYRDRVRGFYLDFERDAPGPLFTDQEELVKHLARSDGVDDGYARARADFRERYAPWDDGEAAGRVVDRVFGPSSA
ncbi:MAG: tagF 3 [Marmoricola sp.]|nr:tagF 3 [Marmoricola sp.]